MYTRGNFHELIGKRAAATSTTSIVARVPRAKVRALAGVAAAVVTPVLQPRRPTMSNLPRAATRRCSASRKPDPARAPTSLRRLVNPTQVAQAKSSLKVARPRCLVTRDPSRPPQAFPAPAKEASWPNLASRAPSLSLALVKRPLGYWDLGPVRSVPRPFRALSLLRPSTTDYGKPITPNPAGASPGDTMSYMG